MHERVPFIQMIIIATIYIVSARKQAFFEFFRECFSATP
jgi:hypothetical protein